MRNKTLILGLGNPILRDDSVGLRIVRSLPPNVVNDPSIEIDEEYWGGLRLMERMIGYDRVIIIDAIQTGAQPGTLHSLTPKDISTQHSASVHDVNLPTALEFGRQAGAALPMDEDITLIGIEVEDVETFDESLTPRVEQALKPAVQAVRSALAPEKASV